MALHKSSPIRPLTRFPAQRGSGYAHGESELQSGKPEMSHACVLLGREIHRVEELAALDKATSAEDIARSERVRQYSVT